MYFVYFVWLVFTMFSSGMLSSVSDHSQTVCNHGLKHVLWSVTQNTQNVWAMRRRSPYRRQIVPNRRHIVPYHRQIEAKSPDIAGYRRISPPYRSQIASYRSQIANNRSKNPLWGFDIHVWIFVSSHEFVRACSSGLPHTKHTKHTKHKTHTTFVCRTQNAYKIWRDHLFSWIDTRETMIGIVNHLYRPV